MQDITIEVKKVEGGYLAIINPTGTGEGQQGQVCGFPDLLTLVLGLGMKLQDLESGRCEFAAAATENQEGGVE